jgi:hypothetical protein
MPGTCTGDFQSPGCDTRGCRRPDRCRTVPLWPAREPHMSLIRGNDATSAEPMDEPTTRMYRFLAKEPCGYRAGHGGTVLHLGAPSDMGDEATGSRLRTMCNRSGYYSDTWWFCDGAAPANRRPASSAEWTSGRGARVRGGGSVPRPDVCPSHPYPQTVGD